VWRISDELVVALDRQLGQPVDSYVNGAQTWLREDGPGGQMVEWRLHPVAAFSRPAGVGTHDVFESVALAIGTGATPLARPESLWEGLEAFVAYDDEAADVEPMRLAELCSGVLGIPPDASGMVEHEPIGAAWEQAEGRFSIVGALLEQLGA
jgi:hypothetical protein